MKNPTVVDAKEPLRQAGAARPQQDPSALQTQAEGETGSTHVDTSPTARANQPERNPLCDVSMVVAICGVPLFWIPFVNLVCPVLSMLLAAIGLRRAGKTGRGWLPAIAGLALGGILFLVGLFVIDVLLSLASVLAPANGATP